MLLCITPNPAIERTWVIPGLRLGGVFRVQEQVVLASGKGVNVARAAQILGAEVLCMGFLAGNSGRLLQDLAEQEGLKGEWIWIEGETRAAVALVNPLEEEDATLISEAGPIITLSDWERLEAAILRNAEHAELVCFSGSFSPGTPFQQFGKLIRQLQKVGKSVWVDCGGEGLATALGAGAVGIKVNTSEASVLVGFPIREMDEAIQAGMVLRRQGTQIAVITMGEKGAVFSSQAGNWWAVPPRIQRVSSVGSGDAFLAGLLIGLNNGMHPQDALRYAAAAGAANAQSLGGGKLQKEHFGAALSRVVVQRIPD